METSLKRLANHEKIYKLVIDIYSWNSHMHIIRSICTYVFLYVCICTRTDPVIRIQLNYSCMQGTNTYFISKENIFILYS